eukprot:scaffold18299_cov117-Isochrysis_galbana.AAC.7
MPAIMLMPPLPSDSSRLRLRAFLSCAPGTGDIRGAGGGMLCSGVLPIGLVPRDELSSACLSSSGWAGRSAELRPSRSIGIRGV